MRTKKKRLFTALAIVALLLAAGGGAGLVILGGAGSSVLEQYIGEQIKRTVNGYLTPDIAFDGLDYQAPKTVVLHNVRLTSPDPDQPGTRVDIFEADSIRMELGELPRPGRPIIIKSLTLTAPTARLIVADDGTVIGYGELLQAEADGDAPPLSEVLQLRLIELRGAAVVLDTREPGTEPTLIDDITTDLHIDPSDGGQYHLSMQLDRVPVMSAAVDAVLDIDQMKLEVTTTELELALDRGNDQYLPQSLQAMIKSYDLTGDLTVSAAGLVDLNTWQESSLNATVGLTDGNAVVGDYRIPIDRLHVEAQTAERIARLPTIEIDAIGGTIRGEAAARLDSGMPFTTTLTGAALMIEQTLQPTAEGTPPRYAGQAGFEVTAGGLLSELTTQLRGGGTLTLREGRVARIAVLSDLIDFMESSGDLRRPDGTVPAGRDKADVAFRIRGDRVYLSQAEIVGSWFAVRGRGNVFLDQRLDVQVNAGPLEKLQDALGVVGDVLGAVTDSVMAYRVGGTVEEPGISVVAFGGLRSAPGDNEEDPPPIPLEAGTNPAPSADENADTNEATDDGGSSESTSPGPDDPDWEPAYDS